MTSLTYGSATRGSAARSQRVVAFATIAGLHVLVLSVIVSGFGKVAMQIVTADIKARILEPPMETTEQPPPPPPTLKRFEVNAGPKPDFPIDIEGPSENAITAPLVEPPVPVAVAQPAPLPIHVVGKHRLPNTDDYYPAGKIRDGIEGTSTIGVCVDVNGKRTSEPTIVQSSDDAGLDAGAMHVLRDGRYARAMRGDQYVPNCYQFRIVFKLRQLP